ncbi:helix-turn-helix domain-containing protein [Pseudoclavibacter helvolus]|uniref:helix-turn-helix domain-containing protein n=1 Tax=Pseudoclavibacter helvolus TaxID=255205 RepID=UPI003C76DFB8
MQRSLEHLFLSLIQSERDLSRQPPPATSLVALAQKVIDVHASNPRFSASRLAGALNVSLSTLYRAYERTGTSPAQEIRSHRLARARRLLSCVREPTPSMLAEVAQLAGFGSLRSMHRARLAELGIEDAAQ